MSERWRVDKDIELARWYVVQRITEGECFAIEAEADALCAERNREEQLRRAAPKLLAACQGMLNALGCVLLQDFTSDDHFRAYMTIRTPMREAIGEATT